MTREEAIKIIDCYDIGFYDLSGAKIPADKLADAFDMAIEALSEDISEDGTLIVKVKDGSKVNRVLVWGENNFGGLYYPDDGNVEIVRCKDCRFNKHPSNDLCPIKRAGVYPDDDDFCAYGERKELDKGVIMNDA